MPTILLRFADLKQRNIARNWPTLLSKIKRLGFPPGRMTGLNERSWTEQEVESWLLNCPTAGPPLRGAAKDPTKRGRGRPKKIDPTSEALANPEPPAKRGRGRPRKNVGTAPSAANPISTSP
jgi:hypothetical protein